MSRLVIVSHRVSMPEARKPLSGGLAVVLSEALRAPAVWFGWSGKKAANPSTTVQSARGVEYLLNDVTDEEYRAYYNGMYNNCVYPILMYRPDLARFQPGEYQGYQNVCKRLAAVLMKHLKPNDRIWVHDNQLMSIVRYLKPLHPSIVTSFFLHLPFPPVDLFETLPVAKTYLSDWTLFDTLGFQTKTDRTNFLAAAVKLLGAKVMADGYTLSVKGKVCRTAVNPVGINASHFAKSAVHNYGLTAAKNFRESLQGRKLIIGAERLDYSKGLTERIVAMGKFWEAHPEFKKKVTFLQIASESRLDVPTYRELKFALDREIGNLNGKLSEIDWTPVRYLTRPMPRHQLAACFRSAAVGLVTPLRDGFNLVAEEYVAAQDGHDPGVLILSQFAGAHELLRASLVVNPLDPEALARAVNQALSMSLGERKERWRALMDVIETYSVHRWFETQVGLMDDFQTKRAMDFVA